MRTKWVEKQKIEHKNKQKQNKFSIKENQRDHKEEPEYHLKQLKPQRVKRTFASKYVDNQTYPIRGKTNPN